MVAPIPLFTSGDLVDFLPGPLDKSVTRGVYTIQRVLPKGDGPYLYRIRHAADSHERVVVETQLAARPKG